MTVNEEHGTSDVQQFYENTGILVTGATGFIGNLLVEKLLRSCPGISRIYLLVRPKKGKLPNERFDDIFNSIAYERLHKEQPDFRRKIVFISGDCAEPDLAISNNDRQTIINEVNIIFHVAANIKFSEPLYEIAKTNLQCTNELLALAEKCKRLKAFVYVSTAYSHCSQKEIEERFYDPPIKHEKLFQIIELFDKESFDVLTPLLLKKWPNTYTYTKAIAEDVVRSYTSKLPIVIVRPSIVNGTIQEPIPSWINAWYGPISVSAGIGLGIIHLLNMVGERLADFVPADYTVNSMIVACTRACVSINETNLIYNLVSSPQVPITWSRFRDILLKNRKNFALSDCIWYPFCIIEPNKYLYLIYWFFFHKLKGWTFDVILYLLGKKPMLTKIYNKIDANTTNFNYFFIHDWIFRNKNTLDLWEQLSPVDKKMFPFNMEAINWPEYVRNLTVGCRIYMLKDPLDTLPKAQRKLAVFRVIHYAFIFLLIVGIFFFFRTIFLYFL